MKRSIRFLLSVVVAVSLSGLFQTTQSLSAQKNYFYDVTRDHWAYETVLWAADNNIVKGDGKGAFNPNGTVTEPEFLAMLLRVYADDIPVAAPKASEQWYEPYYRAVEQFDWPVSNKPGAFNRGHVARLLAFAAGEDLNLNDSIRYLLDHGLAKGKSTNTVAGYKANDTLTRAEAVTFIFRFKQQMPRLQPALIEALRLSGVKMGATEQAVVERLGQPNRKDPAEGGFTWYIYNSDYNTYAQIGISQGIVVALYSNASGVWSSSDNIREGMKASELAKSLNVNVGAGDSYTSRSGGVKTIYYFDAINGYTLDAIMVTDLQAVSGKSAGVSAAALSTARENQVFDLNNVFRLKNGLKRFFYDKKIAATARKHSKDMYDRDFFAHKNPDGLSPFDRMRADGIDYSWAAENIASGYESAQEVHHGWLNSKGHRTNMLSPDLERLGVGVYELEYTQNFYTPMAQDDILAHMSLQNQSR